jgi:DNA-binding IclR family transcriptional regulator
MQRCSALAISSGESAYLAEAADARHAVYVASHPGSHAVRHVSWLGQRVPRRNTAVGAALAGKVDDAGVAVRLDAVEPASPPSLPRCATPTTSHHRRRQRGRAVVPPPRAGARRSLAGGGHLRRSGGTRARHHLSNLPPWVSGQQRT